LDYPRHHVYDDPEQELPTIPELKQFATMSRELVKTITSMFLNSLPQEEQVALLENSKVGGRFIESRSTQRSQELESVQQGLEEVKELSKVINEVCANISREVPSANAVKGKGRAHEV
jgi:hypothetical protein